MLDGAHFLVTCPVDFFARAQVTLHHNSNLVEGPPDCPKAAAALRATLALLERSDIGAQLVISSPIPRSKGLGSSSADVVATIAATALALDRPLSPDTIARIALSVEPSDGVMFPGIALLDHREGKIREMLGPAPPMEIVALDFGGTVDTLEFNATDRRPLWKSIQAEVDEALRLIKSGIQEQDPKLVGAGATISARASQAVLPKSDLTSVLDFAEKVGAVGVNVAHSGTVMGVLLDARERMSKSVFTQAKQIFPEAESVHHFRMLGGGVRVV
jgi:L-threonine kinase